MTFAPAPFAGENDILIQARPPACDPMTYLTLLEYQLTDERLPLLHDILQDEQLTSEIGWDLVKILVGFAPASGECLNDVARLGNPREVILSVAQVLEGLRELMVRGLVQEGNGNGDNDEGDNDGAIDEGKVIVQYEALLEMLPILQSRLVTKYPSRFLGSVLESVLTTFAEMPTFRAAAATLEYIGSIPGARRPLPPPRNGTANDQTDASNAAPDFRAGDPENERPSSDDITGQREVVQRLAQFALLEMMKIYIGGFQDEITSMMWALRLEESRDDARGSMPQMQALSAMRAFKTIRELVERDAFFTQVLTLANDLGIDNQELMEVVATPIESRGAMLQFDTIPQNPKNISFERHGCLILLAARVAMSKQRGAGACPAIPATTMAAIFSAFNAEVRDSTDSESPEAAFVTDSLLAIMAGLEESQTDHSWSMDDASYEAFVTDVCAVTLSNPYKARASTRKVATRAFSASPRPEQRYRLLCKLLSSKEREAAFTKESAIKWFKDELIASSTADGEQRESLLTDATKLSQLISITFSDLPVSPPPSPTDFSQAQHLMEWMAFVQRALPAYLAYVNFYHFLTQSKAVLEKVSLRGDIHADAMNKVFLPMRSVLCQVQADRSGLDESDAEAWESFVLQCSGGVDLALGLVDQIERWGAS